MRNVTSCMLKTALYLDVDDFENLVAKLNPDDTFSVVEDGVVYVTETTKRMLENHFDVKISSIHADGFASVGVWIIYLN